MIKQIIIKHTFLVTIFNYLFNSSYLILFCSLAKVYLHIYPISHFHSVAPIGQSLWYSRRVEGNDRCSSCQRYNRSPRRGTQSRL